MKKGNSIWIKLSLISFVAATLPLVAGFYKMFVYDSGDYYPYEPVNAYVGGDAYNFIINSNYATGFFVLATMLVIMGIGFAILYYLSKISNSKVAAPTAPSRSQVLDDIEANLSEM